MKNIARTLVFSSMLLALTTSVTPQMQPGMIDFTPSMNARVANMNSDLAMAEYNRRNGINERQRIEQLNAKGNAVIKAGKATTKFNSSVEGTEWLAKELQWDADEPQDLPGQVRFIQRYVEMFDKLMAQNGFTPKDAADGLTFSSALAYAAFHDKDMDKAKIQQLRRDWRDYLLKSSSFQGSSEKGKQYTYEQNANLAMQAVEWRIKARRATNAAERKTAEARAQHYAKYFLEEN